MHYLTQNCLYLELVLSGKHYYLNCFLFRVQIYKAIQFWPLRTMILLLIGCFVSEIFRIFLFLISKFN